MYHTNVITVMKPKTYEQMKQRYFENTLNMYPDDCEHDQFEEMSMENDTITWIAQMEGKGKDFKKWSQRCQIEVEARDQGL